MLHQYPYSLCLTFLLTAVTNRCNSETLEQVWQDCRENLYNARVCYGFPKTAPTSIVDNGCFTRKDGCSFALRAKIFATDEGQWNPPITITSAVSHEILTGMESWGVHVLFRVGIDSTVGFHASRQTNGTLSVGATLLEISAGIPASYRFEMPQPYEVAGSDTSLVFSFTIPATGIQLDKDTYTRSSFRSITGKTVRTRTGIITEELVQTVIFAGQDIDTIVNHSGYPYTICGRTYATCIPITETRQEGEQCISKGNCAALSRLHKMQDDRVVLYLRRQLQPSTRGYISAGFSVRRAMGDALVFDCIYNGNSTSTGLSFNEVHSNIAYNYSVNITSRHRTSGSNFFECSWTISTQTNFNMKNSDDLNLAKNSYYFIRAIGGIDGGNGSFDKVQHTVKAVSNDRIRILPDRILGVTAATPSTLATAVTRTIGRRTTLQYNRFSVTSIVLIVVTGAMVIGFGILASFMAGRPGPTRSTRSVNLRSEREKGEKGSNTKDDRPKKKESALSTKKTANVSSRVQ